MNPEPPAGTNPPAPLPRRFGLLSATALNMSNMIGIGPFITIPLLMSALGGPHSMLGWLIAVLIAVPDGMVWSELGAAMPGSGGSYVYLREGFGRETWGRLMAFLFIWQFILSGPLEIASGYIGFTQYLGYVWPGLTGWQNNLIVVGLGLLTIFLLYRRIHSVALITVSLWIGTLLTVGAVIAAGATHFDAKVAFDFPTSAFQLSWGFFWGQGGFMKLGEASRVGVYDYLGYYDICYIGDEVKQPGRVIPRSIIISVIGVALLYFAVNLSVIGVVPWREFVPADKTKPISDYIVAVFMERLYGRNVATFFTLMVLWTTVGSVFALLLGYSRIPYAAAQDGGFFKVFGRLHPQKLFPHVSLVVMGLMAIGCSFFSLDLVINSLLVTRILVQFIAQIAAVTLLRRRAPQAVRPYRMWLYPLPSLLALAGWVFLFATSDPKLMLVGLGTMALGVVAFLIWSRLARRWPFAAKSPR